MKTKNLFLLLFLALIIACTGQDMNGSDSAAKENIDNNVTIKPKNYAEISIKEGGEWDGGEYKGGDFKNVTSLKVPDNHTDHSWYIRYEGPGWESNKVGYRLYLDWRNAIDIFGKLTEEVVLPKVGLNSFDSYHDLSDWGADILKVGEGLGIGSLGRYVDNKVIHFKEVDSTLVDIKNSPSESAVHVSYYGWATPGTKIDLKSILSIKGDQRYTKHTIQPSSAIKGICTGIVKHNDLELLAKESENKQWAYIATYGEQTLIPDELGMAIFYKTSTVSLVIDGEFDYLLEFEPTTDQIAFYFLGAWVQEPDGIKSKEEFINYLDEKLVELNSSNKL